MDATRFNVAILGAGPAGIGAALKLAQTGDYTVTVYEGGERVGGNAGSLMIDGIHCDFGSHRLHPASDPAILADIKSILGDDLLLRPRHGRIRLQGKWIHFPLKPVDLATRLPTSFAASLFVDAATAKLRAPKVEVETFESVMLAGLGRTMCESFYFPYMRKLWGLQPAELAPTLAKRRVSGSSLPKLMKKIFGQVPGLKSPTAGKFYYPNRGFGLICERLSEEAKKAGADVRLRSRFEGMTVQNNRIQSIRLKTPEGEISRSPGTIWSTLPITTLVRAAGSAAPDRVQHASRSIRYRGMILVYLVLEQDRFTEFDAHYFPEESIPISRLSETKNYYDATEPTTHTVLCAELPSDPGDQFWSMDDAALGAKLCEWLAGTGLPVTSRVRATHTRRLPFAYPVYDRGFAENFDVMDDWIGSIDNLLTFGRQGLFAHDNTHHALAMAYGAVSCLSRSGTFDNKRWAELRHEFESHVVED